MQRTRFDIVATGLYVFLVVCGWFSIYASAYTGEQEMYAWDVSLPFGKQLVFIAISALLAIFISRVEMHFFENIAWFAYLLVLVALVAVLFVGKEVGGNKSWLSMGGGIGIQPSEFAKVAAALAFSRYVGTPDFKMNSFRHSATLFLIVIIPVGIIILQKDVGSALVFFSFLLPAFREGMSSLVLVIGIIFVFIFVLSIAFQSHIYLYGIIAAGTLLALWISRKKKTRMVLIVLQGAALIGMVQATDYAMENIFKPHQRARILSLVNPSADPLGVGWNVTQSKIAIGSGGFFGTGFLQGTQTKFDFVPEQSTDFIFCTVGEEQGWVGSLVLISAFFIFFWRIIFIAERQKNKFSRCFGYCVFAILFFHFAINIGMTIGIVPVIGIPLPFFSYGGSSLICFTTLVFILLKLDAHRGQVLQRIYP